MFFWFYFSGKKRAKKSAGCYYFQIRFLSVVYKELFKISLIVSLILDLRGRSRVAGQSLQPPAGRSQGQNQPRGHQAPVSREVPPPENQILIKKNKICPICESMINCYLNYGRKKINNNFVFQLILITHRCNAMY